MIDCIHIEQLEIHVRVGVRDSERDKPQRLILNVTFWPNRAGRRDDIADTVSYSEVAASLKQFLTQRDYRLIETLAEEGAGHLLARFPLRKVAVEVRKFVLPDADHVSVTAIREQ
ncbi:MAG: dihydroneopterin aldolase [Verrucomicrobia bacterium]|nr:MAG: dihydroneopterin aldolase [Verrucomicrobiota bacterium]